MSGFATGVVTVAECSCGCMGKRKDWNHELERYSRGRLRMTLSEWVVNSLDEDYAFDFEVRPTEGFAAENEGEHGDMVLPSPFYIQLKAAEEFNDAEAVHHDFDTDDLRRAPTAATCASCGLSGETIRNWLSHEVPIVCDGCGAVVYEDAYTMEQPEQSGRLLCVDCRP